jgi:hypothetical protein
MAGWDYIVGESGYDQPFVFFNNSNRQPTDGSIFTAGTITIRNSDLSATTVTNAAINIDTLDPLRILYFIDGTNASVPQAVASYLVTITMTGSGQVKKTFELDLRVFNG